MIEPAQIRAARALLDWTIEDLAKASGLNKDSIKNAERSHTQPRTTTMAAIRDALERSGVVFTEGSGVRLRHDIVSVYEGKPGIVDFYNDIYLTALDTKEVFLQFGLRYADIYNHYPISEIEQYKIKMLALNKKLFRCIVSETERRLDKTDYALYRYWPDEKIAGVPFYVYGDKLAIVSIRPNLLQVIVIHQPAIAAEYRIQFDSMWEAAHD
jgi:transcriptional regulator with XRE-family HTH domain